MPKLYPLCSVTSLQKEGRITTFVEELRDEISAFYVENKYWVISTICPHFGGEFDFNPKDCLLTCRWHGWKFNLKTGQSLADFKDYVPDSLVGLILKRGHNQPLGCFPYKGKLTAYKYQIQGDTLEVVVP